MSQKIPPFLKETKNGIILKLHAQPRSSRNRVVGPYGQRLKIAIQAPPADGKANKALQQFLARLLHVPKSCITLKSGASSREKSFLISNISMQEILSRIGI